MLEADRMKFSVNPVMDLEMCALKVRTVGNGFVNNQHRESPPVFGDSGRRLG